ncbi:MAG: TraX family protein [Lachnospiraceae bacterium]
MDVSEHQMGCSGFQLKIIAIFAMVLDHCGAILFPQIVILRYLGRLAFPIFCFLLVEGFVHTHNVRAYEVRLFLFALLSELPFDLAFYQTFFYWEHQNVFFTLFLGLLLLDCLTYCKKEWIQFLMIIGILAVAIGIKCDYDAMGILFILIFYFMRKNKAKKLLLFSAANFIGCGFQPQQAAASLSIIPLWLYNGKKGPSMTWFFYLFYPLHLLILYSILQYS